MPSASVAKNKAQLKGEGHRLQFDLQTGRLTLYGTGSLKPALTDATFGFSTSEGAYASDRPGPRRAFKVAAPEWLGRGAGLEMVCPGTALAPEMALQAFAYAGRPQLFFRLVVRNTTARPLELREMDLLKLALPERPSLNFAVPLQDLSIFRHGWDSWDVSQSIRVRELTGLLVATIDSYLFSQVFDLKSGRSTLLGFVGAQNQVTHVKYVWSGDGRRLKEFRAMAEARHWVLQPGESAESEMLLLEAGLRGAGAQEAYLDLLGKAMGARVPSSVPSGWCSWYYYWGDVSEAGVLKNLDTLSQHRVPVEVVQLDDGWQKEVGDWLECNGKFPHGLAALTRRIHEAGYKAGLWLAPFLVSERSKAFKEHPEWCLQSAPGQPMPYGKNWGGLNYCLDPTHPGVKQYLVRVFRTLTHDWGFDYFKLDFLHAGAMDGIFYQKGLTRAQAFRQGLALMRQLVGDRFLVACGAPLGPSIGLVDAMRIGRDVGPKWDNSYDELFADLRSKHPHAESYLRKLSEYVDMPIRGSMALLRELMVSEKLIAKWNSYGSAVGALQDILCRSALHGRLWLNDPDCVLLREKDTALSQAERRSLATAVSLSGGLVLFSDDASLLGQGGLEDFSRLVPVDPRPARPLDLAEHRIPQLFMKQMTRPWGDWQLVQCCNSADNIKSIPLDFSPLGYGLLNKVHVWDVWEEKYLGSHRGRFEAEPLPGHHSRLLCLRRDSGKVQFLGSSMHLTQGGQEFQSLDQKRHRIALVLKGRPGLTRPGRLYFYLPANTHVSQLRSGVGQAKMSFPQDHVVCVEAEAAKANEIVLEFGKGS